MAVLPPAAGARALVTGAAGFVGSHLVDRLLSDGLNVFGLIGQALRGEPLTVFGDGSQTRSFCHVSDLVEGIWRLACSGFHDPVNCGNPHEMSIRETIGYFRAQAG